MADSAGTNIFRDTPLRFMGYANEVGEAFRPVVRSRTVAASYALAGVYVLGDMTNSAIEKKSAGSRNSAVGIAAFDSLIWQTFASVAIPGLTINRHVALMRYAVNRVRLPPTARAWIPTLSGLALIPVIIHPIDAAVTWAMDNSVRRLYPSDIEIISE